LKYEIKVSRTGLDLFSKISDQRIQKTIAKQIDKLSYDPEKQGKALKSELSGYRSTRAAGQRYRIIYQMDSIQKLVYILAVGIRKEGDKKDIYNLTKKLIKLRLLDT